MQTPEVRERVVERLNSLELTHQDTVRNFEQLMEDVSESSETVKTEHTERLESTSETDRLINSARQVELIHDRRSEREVHVSDERVRAMQDAVIVNQITRRVIDRWHESAPQTVPAPAVQYDSETVSFVHKSVENYVDEETLENLREEIKRVQETSNRTIKEISENQTTENRVVNNVTREVTEENDEEIQKLVNRTLRRQMDAISERVYTRIEKQLQNERRRRGL
jgi:hypothetical protein